MRFIVLPASALLVGAAIGCSTSSTSPPTPPPPAGDSGVRPVTCTGTAVYDAWVSDPNLCVYVFATGLGRARQMAFAENGDLFVSNRSITVLWDANGDGHSDETERATFASAPGLNHGLAFSPDGRFLYASSESTVYRWAYTRGARAAAGEPEIAVKNLPAGGNHVTRTLAFDSRGRLYVSVGSAGNVDTAQTLRDTRSQIRRFDVSQGSVDYANGEIVARGMRNEVGMFIDADDRLWGVENGRDNLTDPDFGGDIHDDNPSEEINLVDGRGPTFYGYPDCYSEYRLPSGRGAGTEWADPTIANPKSDAFCQDANTVRPPAFAMPSHWAPLGIVQYAGASLPFAGDFLIAAHGSWNRAPATGKLIARARVQNGAIVGVDPIVGEKNAAGELAQGAEGAPRPVDVRVGPNGALFYSDDAGGRIFKVGYRSPNDPADAGADASNGDCTPSADGLPQHLRCTGLYTDFATKTLASSVIPYRPGLELWSDGAEKQRYFSLPKGTTIDTRDMDEWSFPVGTKAWKEFRLAGARVETRIYEKRGAREWSWATYRWTPDESDAVRLDTGATAGNYEIPNHAACEKCHAGRTDKLLGVEAIALSVPGAEGLTLSRLAEMNALSHPPAKTTAALPEDATGKAAPALGALHMNCGVSCHNRNESAGAVRGNFFLRLPATAVLAGTANVQALDTWTTGVGVTPEAVTYRPQIDAGYKRILPGDAAKSLAPYAMGIRQQGQMPPLASHRVDTNAVQIVSSWIDALTRPGGSR